VKVVLFTSAFCEPCIRTRAVLAEVSRIVPNARVIERDIVADITDAQRADIRSTPTAIVLRDDDTEVFRAEGVPTVNQVLAALAQAL
jgi:Thioredoxin.